jgi:signal peptidase I
MSGWTRTGRTNRRQRRDWGTRGVKERQCQPPEFVQSLLVLDALGAQGDLSAPERLPDRSLTPEQDVRGAPRKRVLGMAIAAPLTRTFRNALSFWRLALLGILAVLVLTTLTGVGGSPLRVVVVAGESMLPTLGSGDAVLTLRRSSYNVGEIVAYRVPANEPAAGTIVIHRIVRVTPEGFLLQGDNNGDLDPWTPREGEIVGERALTVPKVGLAIGFLRTALGTALIAAFVTFLVALDAGERKRSGRTA